ncbi:light-harvesting protein [Polynucleobacter sp. IMCC30063]|uniref:light-harvesting protein n=1 Tax=unclassified Polynucleobacter TaxID=2640945 RepID=UPI001F2671FA|nr:MULTISPECIES: light-harvesting protein [unclassified Polynucleobacter]MCE7506822.1 light-harvesting protein [Polynucleobacter sp. IMCC30063]MCE7528101.1 light-harvesting protein [Polynucleobacter sp. IMCC 30228]MCE7529940.1 light-harvesting protein [Polynucleobacter sp. IMCC 29146]
MIYGKMWTVVKPTVGIPIFIAAVAISSFCVHLAIVSNTTWVKAFLQGNAPMMASSAATMAAPMAAPMAAAPAAKK